MDINALLYFKKVAETEHMTKAAEELHISQPNLSKTIQRLEESLGQKLFDRKGRNIELNAYGKLLLSHVNTIALELDKIEDIFHSIHSVKMTPLNFGAENSLLSMKWMPDFTEKYKEFYIRHFISNKETLLNKLLSKEIDFTLTLNPVPDSRFHTLTFSQEKLCYVVSKSHPLANRTQMYALEGKDLSFLALPKSKDFPRLIDYVGEQAGFVPNIVFEAESFFHQFMLDNLKSCTVAFESQTVQKNIEGLKDVAYPYHVVYLKDSFATINVSLSCLKERLQEPKILFMLNYFNSIRDVK